MFILLCSGLMLIPFAVWPGLDSREPKMALALAFALALGLAGLHKGLKPVKNKWLLLLIGFLLVNIWLCPKPVLPFKDLMIQAFWVWKPLSSLLIFFLMYLSVISIELSETQRKNILVIMSWVGLVMSGYCILQFFGIDQFYQTANRPFEIPFIPSSQVGGTLGQPTLVSPFIAMLIPIALYLKKYWFALVMIVAVLLTRSQIAIGALIASLVFFQALKDKKTSIRIGILSLILIVVSITAYFQFPKIKSIVGDNGRFTNWKQITKSINSPIIPSLKQKYPITGLGLGSFESIYHINNNSPWRQAHNEYLEILYNTGIIGLFLFLMALWTAIKGVVDRQSKFLLTSFICIAICAGGTFVWQLGAHLFYSIVILALLNKREVQSVGEV